MNLKFEMKRGVSLITVLLFMLVATIAATATYKWITSEGRSSTSRMMEREAYQSAVAGIENARAWMTYHANDVGALIKQYQTGGGKPIKLNERLTPWLLADQHYDVWLTGVNTGTAHNFKLKILSAGESRQGTRHSEVAIFNVDGLYRVTIPNNSTVIHFDKAFDGLMTTGITGSDTLQSGLIHGDFEFSNTPKITGPLVAAGDVGFGGTVYGDDNVYITGGLTTANGGYEFGKTCLTCRELAEDGISYILHDTNIVYIGGNVTCASNNVLKVHGDLHIGGNLSCNCQVDVTGNFTIGGTLCNNGSRIKVGKNLVFKKDASIDLGSGDQAGKFEITKNAYLTKTIEGHCGNFYGNCGDDNGNRKSTISGDIYKYDDATHYYNIHTQSKSGYLYGVYMQGVTAQTHVTNGQGDCSGSSGECKKCRLFSIDAPSGAYKSSSKISKWKDDDNVLKDVSDNYWTNIRKMEAYGKVIKNDGTIPQPIMLKDSAAWMGEFKNTYCELPNKWTTTGDNIEKLNTCYQNASDENILFNGYLPILWEYDEDKDPGSHKLEGKFLIYASQPVGTTTLPATTENSVVLLYLHQGTSANGQLKGKHGEDGKRDWVYNYLIYSNGDINEINGLNVRGSVVMANGTGLKKMQGNCNLQYKSEVLQGLADAGVIQENTLYTSAVTGEEVAVGGGDAGENRDAYYIANAPQLYITLETQYENNENIPSGNNQEDLEPSFVILPRIIHLPKNPYGRLTDYFNVVNLNGSNLVKDANKIKECTDIPKTTLLYDHAASPAPSYLSLGYHRCIYEDANQRVPFYVNISDNTINGLPPVNFQKSYQPMSHTSESHVILKYPAGSNEQFEVTVSKSATNGTDGWTITPVATLKSGTVCTATSTSCVFALQFDNNGQAVLFDVRTENAEEGTYPFTITDCSGCQIVNPDAETFSISSFVTINRAEIGDFCTGPGAGLTKCAAGGEYYKAQSSTEWPDCPVPSNTWVKAVGTSSGSVVNNCSIESTNAQWTCGLSTDIEMRSVEEGVPAGCQAVVPTADEGNKQLQSSLEDGHEYTLYATLKAKRAVLTINFAGKDYGGKNIQVASTTRWGSETRTCTASDDGCTFDLFTGDDVTITAPNDGSFSYWKCDPTNSANCADNEPLTTRTYSITAISGSNTITAYFNQKDQHCFFDEFNAGTVNCSADNDGNISNEYCLDYCSDKSDCYIGKGSYPSAAKWLVIGNSSDQSKIYNEDGSIAVGREHNRGKKKNTVEPVVIMSTTNSGLYGTLRAQFLVPRLDREGDESSIRVDKSGFLLRSNNDGTQAVRLVLFADTEGKLKAKVCKGTSCLAPVLLETASHNSISVGATDIVTLSAIISKIASNDVLTVKVVKGNYGAVEEGEASFTLKNLAGYLAMNTRSNEFVGISLADPDFKIYDIGWHSDDYNAECWDTYPTVKCSFRAAYIGGIVPLNKKSAPWVGLSSWFDDKGCTPDYYYQGDDACGNSTGDAYIQCTDKYTFTSGGIHGTKENNVDTKMAKVKISYCGGAYISDEDKNLLYQEDALCGSFWVGDVKNCSRDYTIYTTTGTGKEVPKHPSTAELGEITTDELFGYGTSGNFAKLRGAKITVAMNNPNGQEVEIYLRSTGASTYYGSAVHFSKSIITTGKTGVEFNVDDMSNDLGFDPENVSGVIIRNLGENTITVTSITAECDYTPSITCDDVTFENDHFEIKATVQNVEDAIGSYVITGTEKVGSGSAANVNDLAKTYVCEENSLTPCPIGDAQGKIALNSGTYNPYTISWGDVNTKEYEFEVHMKYKDGTEAAHCTKSKEQHKFSAECRWSGDATKPRVDAGAGLPQYFQYQLASCPGGGCKWEVYFESTKLKEGTGLVNSYTSLSSDEASAINTSTNPLDEDKEYTIYFKNASDATSLFAECSKTFVVGGEEESSSSVAPVSSSEEPVSSSEEPVSSSEAPVSSSEVASSSSAAAVTAVCSSVSATIYSGQENIELPVTMSNLTPTGVVRSVYIASSSSALYTDPSDNNCNSNYCPDVKITAPSAGNYTYILKIGNDELCRNTMTVIDPYMSCWIEDEDGNTITNQELESGTDYVLYWQCHAANTGSFGGNYNKNGSYAGGATCSNGICSVSTSETTGGTYAYTLDIWNCKNSAGSEITACSNTVTVAASSSSEESSGSGTTYCSVTPTFIHSDCSTNSYGTNGFNTTGKICVKIHGNVGGFNCSECAGRSWRINGGSSTTSTPSITATADGYSYIDVSEGSHSWASMAFYNISCP